MMRLQYTRERYNVPAIKGEHVMFMGKLGVITGYRGAYLRVRFAGEYKISLLHPTWCVDYKRQQKGMK